MNTERKIYTTNDYFYATTTKTTNEGIKVWNEVASNLVGIKFVKLSTGEIVYKIPSKWYRMLWCGVKLAGVVGYVEGCIIVDKIKNKTSSLR